MTTSDEAGSGRGQLPKPSPLRSISFLPALLRAFFCPLGLHCQGRLGRDTITRQSVVFLVGLLPASQCAFAAEPQPCGVHLQWHTTPCNGRLRDVSPLLIRRALRPLLSRFRRSRPSGDPMPRSLPPLLSPRPVRLRSMGKRRLHLALPVGIAQHSYQQGPEQC